jgi:pimeloyl-ACP methyl ester carboxylesterase
LSGLAPFPDRWGLPYGGDVSDTNSAAPVGDLESKVLAFDELQVLDGHLYWVESWGSGTSIARWSPEEGTFTRPFEIGSSAHSYGGGAFTLSAGRLLAVSSATGQICDPVEDVPLTARSGSFGALTSAAGSVAAILDTGDTDQLITLQPGSEAVEVLWEAPFLASPAVAGQRIAWAQWPESAAPWNHCEVWTADLVEGNGLSSAVRIAGGPEESAIEPKWGSDGDLYFMSDRTGWWNLYRWNGAEVVPVAPVASDCAAAPWELGYSSYAFLESGRIAMLARNGPPARLLLASPSDDLREVTTPYTSIKPYVAAIGDRVAVIGSSPAVPAQIALIDVDQPDTSAPIRISAAEVSDGPAGKSEIHTFDSDGVPITLVWNPPHHHEGGPVPTIVRAHPGPTHHLEMRLDADLWYYTEQGFAVIDVDYRGSTGYGREFRQSLYGHWGVFDARDCTAAARWALDTNRAQSGAVFIIGASAGGFTALHAASLPDNPFALAVARSAIVDPAKWVSVTPRFHRPNARALGGAAVGAEKIGIPLLLIHGDDDKVVPVNDIVDLTGTLRGIGSQVELIRFPDGGHYLSGAKVKPRVLEAEVRAFRSMLNRPRPAGSG